MSHEDDWYREYEAERQRLVTGGQSADSKKNLSAAEELAAYYGSMQPDPSQRDTTSAPSAPTSTMPTPSTSPATQVPSPAFAPPAPTYGAFTNEDDAMAYYASQGTGHASSDQSYNASAFPLDYPEQDNRFGVKFVQLPPELNKLKVGRLLYFACAVDVYFKGFFSPSKVVMGLAVTPKCMWFSDLKTGNLIICKEIADIKTLFVVGDTGIGLRTGQGADVFFKSVVNRERLIAVLKRLFSATGKALNVITGGEDREKSYRNEIVYLDRAEWQYCISEDPRTGLELVEVPEKHLEHYGVLAPKNLHWFGGCNQVSLAAMGKLSGTRRGGWITPTGIFLSIHTGPRPDGSQIVRCVPIESLRCVIDGPGFAVGFNIQSVPPQPDLVIDFDDQSTKLRILFILEQCFLCRTGQYLITRKSPTFGGIRIVDDRKFVPELFRMSTRTELYGLLRGKP